MVALEKVLRDLYDSEINVCLSCFWDIGWTVKLGDEFNGYVAEGHFDGDNVDGVTKFLIEQATFCFPSSPFAKAYA